MNLPKRYALSVEVKLIEIPGQFNEPEPEISLSDDPMKMASQIMGKMGQVALAHPVGYQQPSGFDWRKSATVSVSNFSGVAKILEQFDELTQQIDAEQP